MTKVKKSLDGVVSFYEKSHIYKIKKKKLISGTTLLKPFFGEFNATDISRKISKGFKFRNHKKELAGIEVTDLEKKKATMKFWKNEWKESALHGSRTHALMENFILELNNIPNDLLEAYDYVERDFNKAEVGAKWVDVELEKLDNPELYPEYIVYNEEIGVAGQIDLKIIDAKGVTHLWDWKSNKAIDKKSKYGLYCSEPISDLSDCTYVKYMLQLSLYAYMEELKGATIGDLIVVHLKEDKVVPYKVEYRKDLIEKLLSYEDTKNE